MKTLFSHTEYTLVFWVNSKFYLFIFNINFVLNFVHWEISLGHKNNPHTESLGTERVKILWSFSSNLLPPTICIHYCTPKECTVKLHYKTFHKAKQKCIIKGKAIKTISEWISLTLFHYFTPFFSIAFICNTF